MSAARAESLLLAAVLPEHLPAVDRVLGWPQVAPLLRHYGRPLVTGETRALLGSLREAMRAGRHPQAVDAAALTASLAARLDARVSSKLKPVFNLTGTVVHTNLGRALLPAAAVEALLRVAAAPINLEYDLAGGERGDRDSLIEGLLSELTGAEAATVVNNNAAAVLLTVAALASKREVIVSRGELVEIGGAFRMPEVMAAAGARLREIGTTNRTHAQDYSEAIGPRSALIMKVHTSNYVVRGYTAAVDEAALAGIAHGAGLPFAVDLGSGSLVDLALYGLPREPLVQDCLAHGADVVTFSGDKLLGGPQAGLIVGRRDTIAKIKRHPLKRALRVSKLTLAALEATLALYRNPEALPAQLPTLRWLTRPSAEIMALTARLAPTLAASLGAAFEVRQEIMQSQIGSGSLPEGLLPSAGLMICCRSESDDKAGAKKGEAKSRGSGRRLSALAAAFRALPIPVIGRVAEGALVFDLRTLDDEPGFLAQLSLLRLQSEA